MKRKLHKDELIEYLNDNYSTLGIDEAHFFVNKHFNNEPGILDTVAHNIAIEENLIERVKDDD